MNNDFRAFLNTEGRIFALFSVNRIFDLFSVNRIFDLFSVRRLIFQKHDKNVENLQLLVLFLCKKNALKNDDFRDFLNTERTDICSIFR